jgi:hypothetical protein
MERYDIINDIIKTKGFSKYLEIGVRNPDDCYNKINCNTKHSVDPGYENEKNNVDFKFTSDDFFNRLECGLLELENNYKWDVIFIDGLHISNQVEKDVLNSLNHLSEDGFILLHDCNPFLYEYNYERVIEDYWGQGWNGTVWKVIYKLLCTREDLDVYTINTDEGVGLIKRGTGRKLLEFENHYYEYKELHKNLEKHLNIITINELNNILKYEKN